MKLNLLKCIWSQFGKFFRLYGNLERNRGQSHPAYSDNGLSSSYHSKGSTTTNWPVGSSRAVYIPFYKPIKTLFYDPKGSQIDRVE